MISGKENIKSYAESKLFETQHLVVKIHQQLLQEHQLQDQKLKPNNQHLKETSRSLWGQQTKYTTVL